MSDQQKPNPQHLDDKLAEFTDRLMDDGDSEMSAAPEQDQELIELQETVLRLKRAFGSEQPAEDVARRIRANLLDEWQKTRGQQQSEDTLLERLSSAVNLRRLTAGQVYALALLVIVVIAGLVLSTGSSGGGDLSGAAGGQVAQGLLPIIVVGGVALGGVVWWLVRRRRP